MHRNIHEAMYEDLIEIAWAFDKLINEGKIKTRKELMEELIFGLDDVKAVFVSIAKKFEKKYPFDTAWNEGRLNYLIEIQIFAREELIKVFGNK